MSKRGGLPIGFIVLLILSLVTGAIVLVITGLFGIGITQGFAESLCLISSATRDRVPFPDLCETSLQFIDPNDEFKCPASISQEEPRLCLPEQMYQLAARCWTQRGRGNLNPGDFDCYFVCIGDTYEVDGFVFETVPFDRTEMENVSRDPYRFESKGGASTTYATILPTENFHIFSYEQNPSAIYSKPILDAWYVSSLISRPLVGVPERKLIKRIGGEEFTANAGPEDDPLDLQPGEFIKIEFVDTNTDGEDVIIMSSFGVRCSLPTNT